MSFVIEINSIHDFVKVLLSLIVPEGVSDYSKLADQANAHSLQTIGSLTGISDKKCKDMIGINKVTLPSRHIKRMLKKGL